MSDNCGSTWPEQDAVDKWFDKYGRLVTPKEIMELKKAVTKPRIEVQDKLTQSQSDPEQANERIKEFICIERNLNIELETANNSIKVLAEALDELVKAEWMVSHDWGGDRKSIMNKCEELANQYKEKAG